MPQGRKLTGPDVKHFIMAGDAIFSLKNTLNGHHLTYRMELAPNSTDFWFVKVLAGSDNTSDYAYLGTVKDDKYTAGLSFKRGVKSKIGEDATSAVTARWFFDKLNKGALPASLEVWHEGRCGRCARKLTVPESIDAGIGPECAKHMGLVAVHPEPCHKVTKTERQDASLREHLGLHR